MNSSTELAALLFEMKQMLARLGTATQAGNSTVGGSAAISIADVVTEAAVTNAALPMLQDDAAENSAAVSDLQSQVSAVMEDLDARLEDARADLADKAADLEQAQEVIRDAFGQEIEGLSDRIDQIVVGADGVLLLYSDEAPTADDKAPAGSTWWMINESKGIVGQWQQVGTDAAPVWEPRPIESDLIANLDVGKLSAGQAAIAQVVAQKIAASTASIQTVNVENLFVTSGATMAQAVIEYLFANVVAAKKITADMIDVNSLSGVTLTGATLQTSPSGERVVITAPGGAQGYTNAINWFTSAETAGSVRGFGSLANGSRYPGLSIVSGGDTEGRLGSLDVAIQPLYDANYADGNSVNAPKVGLVTSRSMHAQGHLQASGYLASASGLMLRSAGNNDWTKNWYPVIKPSSTNTSNASFAVDTNGGTVAAATVTATAFRTPDGTAIVEDTDWITVPTASIGPNYTVRAGYPVKYRRKNGIVYVIGQVYSKAGAAAGGQGDLLTFPAGFRPPGPGDWFTAGVLAWSHYNQVTAAGVLSIFSNTVRTSSTGYPLDGLQFIAS